MWEGSGGVLKNGASTGDNDGRNAPGNAPRNGPIGKGNGSASIALTGCGDRRSLRIAILRDGYAQFHRPALSIGVYIPRQNLPPTASGSLISQGT